MELSANRRMLHDPEDGCHFRKLSRSGLQSGSLPSGHASRYGDQDGGSALQGRLLDVWIPNREIAELSVEEPELVASRHGNHKGAGSRGARVLALE